MIPDKAMILSHERSAIARVHAECGTCEDRGGVTWFRPLGHPTEDVPHNPRLAAAVAPAHAWRAGMNIGVDTCPECGRGREVGRL